MSSAADIQQLAPGTVVTLYTIDHSDAGGPLLRFTPGSAEAAGAPVVVNFDGHVYLPLPVELAGVSASVSGQSARPTLTVSAVRSAATIALLGADNLRGARITRVRTLAQFLDGQPGADATRTFGEGIWRIERVGARSKTEVEWQLASALDFDNAKLPARQVLRDVCAWEYRRWDPAANAGAGGFVQAPLEVRCPYNYGHYFTADDVPTTDPAKDQCSRRLSGCQARYRNLRRPFNVLPFGGFPGLGVRAER